MKGSALIPPPTLDLASCCGPPSLVDQGRVVIVGGACGMKRAFLGLAWKRSNQDLIQG